MEKLNKRQSSSTAVAGGGGGALCLTQSYYRTHGERGKTGDKEKTKFGGPQYYPLPLKCYEHGLVKRAYLFVFDVGG